VELGRRIEKNIRHFLGLRQIAGTQETQLLLQAELLARAVRALPDDAPIQQAEFKCFSQWGEDGILQFLTEKVPVSKRAFVEFGVQDYAESNTRFLMMRDYWSGLVIDGSARNIRKLKRNPWLWKYGLQAVASWITRDNINDLIRAAGLEGPIGLLSVDIDGNDYWVWEAIHVVDPDIVVCEYNNLFGPHRAVTVPYAEGFDRKSADPTLTYWGASLRALCLLAERKGYAFVGSNRAGVNAFFVKSRLMGNLRSGDPVKDFLPSSFHEAWDPVARTRPLGREARLNGIAHLPVVDVESGETLSVGACQLLVG
jgi:hypothetical protein